MMAVSTLVLFSCGDDASADASGDAASTEEGAENAEGTDAGETVDATAGGEMELCDCLNLQSQYPSRQEAVDALGEGTVSDCMDKITAATPEQRAECLGVSEENVEAGKEAAEMVKDHM